VTFSPMTDLFSGQRKLAPWIQSVVYDTLLGYPQQQQHYRPKVVQVLDIGPRIDNVPGTLRISDGEAAIVTVLSEAARDALKPEADRITRGCVVRIHDWSVRLNDNCAAGGDVVADDLFRRYAVSTEHKISIHLCIKTAVIPLGGQGLAVSGNPIPVLETVDVRRALQARCSGKVNGRGSEEGTARNSQTDNPQTGDDNGGTTTNLPVGNVAALFDSANATSFTLSKIVAAGKEQQQGAASGNQSFNNTELFGSSTETTSAVPTDKQSAASNLPNNNEEDAAFVPNSALVAAPIGNVEPIFARRGRSSLMSEILAAAASPQSRITQPKRKRTPVLPSTAPTTTQTIQEPQPKRAAVEAPEMSALAKSVERPQNHEEEMLSESSSDEEEEEENLGISNMLVSQEATGMQTQHDDGEELPAAKTADLSQTLRSPDSHPEIEGDGNKDDDSDRSGAVLKQKLSEAHPSEMIQESITQDQSNEQFVLHSSKGSDSGRKVLRKQATSSIGSRASSSEFGLETQEGFPNRLQVGFGRTDSNSDEQFQQQEERNGGDFDTPPSLSGPEKGRLSSTMDQMLSGASSSQQSQKKATRKFQFGGDSIRAWLK